MQLLARGMAAKICAAILVVVSLSAADYVARVRLKPEVSAVSWIADKADYANHVLNIHQLALARAHGLPESLLPIYDIQNPGFFLLIAELYARVGATSPRPLEITSIVLFNVAALCFFSWVYLLFADLCVAAFATAFLVTSQFFLFFPGMTHTFPFEFFFFNLTMLFYLLFLRKDKPAYLVMALLAMFMTCMNYWFYYMSTWIIMIGLWWQFRGRPRLKEIAMISAPPVAAAAFTMAMVTALFGVKPGIMRLTDLLVARMFDARIPGGHWYPDQRFMTAEDWSNYPTKVMQRLEWAYSIDFFWFAIGAACAFVLLWFRNRSALISALVLLLGGFSWYYVMFQHTHIHHFSGQFSFMAVCPIFGLIAAETIATVSTVARLDGIVAAPALGLRNPGGGMTSIERHMVLGAAAQFAIATLVVAITFMVVSTYATKSAALFQNTVTAYRQIEPRYREAIASICGQHGTVTLPDLQSASKDWGIAWQPNLIADTNQLPHCQGS
jgi:hypothetical protein